MCDHDWRKSNLRVHLKTRPKSPPDLPPYYRLFELELCTKCGLLRVPIESISSLKEK